VRTAWPVSLSLLPLEKAPEGKLGGIDTIPVL
jgi:hypothetical protein